MICKCLSVCVIDLHDLYNLQDLYDLRDFLYGLKDMQKSAYFTLICIMFSRGGSV